MTPSLHAAAYSRPDVGGALEVFDEVALQSSKFGPLEFRPAQSVIGDSKREERRRKREGDR